MINSATSAPSSVLDTPSNGTRADAASDPAAAQDRFLKLLVAQLNNQDPMNPMDNAQMTSQIAQINTVTGIQQLNETVKGLSSQFAAQQLMQGSAMVGRNVLVADNSLAYDAEGKKGGGAFDLSTQAASVQVKVLDASNKEVGTVNLGPQKAGRYNFEWENSTAGATGPFHFSVAAANGDTPVQAQELSIDQVIAVSMENGALSLQLARGGNAGYSAIKSIL